MNKEQLLQTKGKVVDTLTVPDWGPTKIRRLSFNDVDRFNAMQDKPTRALALLVCLAVCDDNGNRVFVDDDLDSILDLPAEVVIPVGQAVAKWIGVSFEKVEDAKKN